MEQNKDQIGAAVRGEAVAKCTVPPIGWRCTRIAGHEGPCAAYPIDEAAEKYEAEMLEVIDQRDKYHDMADQLAAQIAAMTEVDIGEHSSANEPWRNALIAGDEFIAAKFKAFCNGPVSARAADAPSEPSELAQELRTGADAAQHRFPGYAAVMRRAAAALDSQPTEPTGYVRISELKKLESNRVAGVGMMVQKEGGDGWTPIYASSQPNDGGVRNGSDLKAVHAFLMGESPLEGVQFGDKHPTKAGAFWWRLNLRAALAKG